MLPPRESTVMLVRTFLFSYALQVVVISYRAAATSYYKKKLNVVQNRLIFKKCFQKNLKTQSLSSDINLYQLYFILIIPIILICTKHADYDPSRMSQIDEFMHKRSKSIF